MGELTLTTMVKKIITSTIYIGLVSVKGYEYKLCNNQYYYGKKNINKTKVVPHTNCS